MKCEDFFLNKTYFTKLTDIDIDTLDEVIQDNPNLVNMAGEIKVFAFFNILLKQNKADEQETIPDSVKINQEIQREKLLSLKLANQIKLGQVILKSEAINRVRDVLISVKQMIVNAISLYSGDKPNKREVAQELTIAYKKALDTLKNESEIVSWTSEGDETTILKTRLNAMEKLDKEFTYGS